jgi:hypothetical protein
MEGATMRIGFTGHRPNRLPIGNERVTARLAEVCADLKMQATGNGPESAPVAISALAEGSDRLFAEAALGAGFALHALFPMPVADYVRTFQDSAAMTAFQVLLARAATVQVLPGSLADTKGAYDALSRIMVGMCDVLVTVWDGKPAAGRGGTTEVIQLALEQGRRVIWIDAASDRSPVELHANDAGFPAPDRDTEA